MQKGRQVQPGKGKPLVLQSPTQVFSQEAYVIAGFCGSPSELFPVRTEKNDTPVHRHAEHSCSTWSQMNATAANHGHVARSGISQSSSWAAAPTPTGTLGSRNQETGQLIPL